MNLWQIWWVALAVKTILLPIIPITPDETYYFTWARHLQLSYFDHPPFIAWLMTLALPLWKTPLGIRLPGILMSHLGFIPWIGILNRLGFSKKAQGIWMLGILLGPLTGLGAFVITPDIPLVFFWSLGILCLLWTIENPRPERWVILGIVFGLGMLSKYPMILFAPAAVLWLYWERKLFLLKSAGPWLGAVAAVLVFSPVIIWNFQNGFASFAFQTHHGLAGGGFRWNWPLEYVSSQFGLINPFIAVIGSVVIFKFGSKNKLLSVFSCVPFLFFFLTSFRARAEANWPVCGYPCLIALAASVVDDENFSIEWERWLKRSFLLSSFFILIVVTHTIHPWLPIRQDKDHTKVTREWLDDVSVLEPYNPLYASSYQMASFLSYFRKPENEVFKLKGLDRKDSYDFFPQSVPHSNGYVVLKAAEGLTPTLAEHFIIRNPVSIPNQFLVYELIQK